ncbi:MAG: hypothetical protein ABI564_06925 [Ideonella sp.]
MNLTLGLQQTQRHDPDRIVSWYGERRRTYGEMAGRVARGLASSLGYADNPSPASSSVRPSRM